MHYAASHRGPVVPFAFYICFLGVIHTSHEEDGRLVGVKLHLPGNPRPVEVRVPPALLLALRLFVLVRGADERDAEEALGPGPADLLRPRQGRGSHALLGCWTEGGSHRGRAMDTAFLILRDHAYKRGSQQ